MSSPNMNQPELRKTENLTITLQVTLEELYSGTERIVRADRNIICRICKGTGSEKKTPETEICQKCHGFAVRRAKMPRSKDRQLHEECNFCWTKGRTPIPKHRCFNCGGRGVVMYRDEVVIEVKCGSKNGHKITFEGKSTQEPNKRPGDIVVTLASTNHPTFRRKGNDLAMTMSLTLTEALCGFKKTIVTLDKREIFIRSPPGTVVKDNDRKCVFGEGMPKFKRPDDKGNLIITFQINYPTQIRGRFMPTIEGVLGPKPIDDIPMDALERNMIDMTLEEDGANAQDYEEEDYEQHYEQHNGQNYAHAQANEAGFQHHGQHNYEQFNGQNHAYAETYVPDFEQHNYEDNYDDYNGDEASGFDPHYNDRNWRM